VSYTVTATRTYTATDIEKVVRRFRADLAMIAQSTTAITEQTARHYADDVETLAKAGYLKKVDLTLFDDTEEVYAAVYTVNAAGEALTSSLPGGVMWSRVANPSLRIVLSYTDSYTGSAEQAMQPKLHLNWIPTNADTSHSTLKLQGGRDYMSNGWAMERKDYSK
jgi:hypothetical protein